MQLDGVLADILMPSGRWRVRHLLSPVAAGKERMAQAVQSRAALEGRGGGGRRAEGEGGGKGARVAAPPLPTGRPADSAGGRRSLGMRPVGPMLPADRLLAHG